MLRKLMKHELRATGRVMLPLFLLVLITAAGANLATRTLLEADNKLMNLMGIILLTAFIIAIAAACIMAFALMIQRFYKNLLQDEGYVMMTLPVSVHKHVCSKLFVSLLWYAASFFVVALAFFILMFDIEFAKEFTGAFKGLLQYLKELFPDGNHIHAIIASLEFFVFIILAIAANCLEFYAAMSIGQSFANRKILMSVLVYFGINFIMQILGGVFGIIVDKSGLSFSVTNYLDTLSVPVTIHVVMAGLLLFTFVLNLIFYFISTYFLKNKLNLE